MAKTFCSFLGGFILLSYIDLFIVLYCCTGGGQHISALDGVGRKDERLCVCVRLSQWAPPTSCIKAPCLVCSSY